MKGGREASKNAFPYMAALVRDVWKERVQFCGGAIISELWILTAAYCVSL